MPRLRPVNLFVPDSLPPLILSLETATRAGSVALARGSELLAMRGSDAQTSHSTKLLQRVEEVLAEAGASLQDVELFAAASGPGSFTGLRIGLATIKSFAATLSRPCVGISTLSAIAYAAGSSEHTLALIPAGRGELFAQLLSVNESGEVKPLGEAVHQTAEKLLDSVIHIKGLKWAGEGFEQYESLIKERAEREGISLLNGKASLKDSHKFWALAQPIGALAGHIAALAHQCYLRGETFGPDELKAIYVRPSDAELSAQER